MKKPHNKHTEHAEAVQEATGASREEAWFTVIAHSLSDIRQAIAELEKKMIEATAIPGRMMQVGPAGPSTRPGRKYLNGRWINADGTDYHPLDEEPGALEQAQRVYQAGLRDESSYSDDQPPERLEKR